MPEVHDFLKKQWEVVENERKRQRERAENERIAKERDKRLEKIALFITRIIPWVGAYLIPIITVFVDRIIPPYGILANLTGIFFIPLVNLFILFALLISTLFQSECYVLVSLIISTFLYFGFCGLLVYFLTGRNIINLW